MNRQIVHLFVSSGTKTTDVFVNPVDKHFGNFSFSFSFFFFSFFATLFAPHN